MSGWKIFLILIPEKKIRKSFFMVPMNISSAQAWFILKALIIKGVLYFLDGGFNSWKNDILYPKTKCLSFPGDSVKFEKIKQVSLHFGGSPQMQISETTSDIGVAPSPTVAPNLPKVTMPSGTTKRKRKDVDYNVPILLIERTIIIFFCKFEWFLIK